MPSPWVFCFVHPSQVTVTTTATMPPHSLTGWEPVGAQEGCLELPAGAVPPLRVWMRAASLISPPRSKTADSIRSTSLHPPSHPERNSPHTFTYLLIFFFLETFISSALLAGTCSSSPSLQPCVSGPTAVPHVKQALESSQLARGRCKEKFCLLPKFLPTSELFCPNPASPDALDLHFAACKTGNVTINFAKHFASLLGGNL